MIRANIAGCLANTWIMTQALTRGADEGECMEDDTRGRDAHERVEVTHVCGA